MIAKPDPNITIGGQPVDEYLDGETKRRVHSEISQVIQEQTRKPRYHSVKQFEQQEDTRRVSRRVKHLSHNQIRREYGLMAKPMNTIVENVLYVLKEQGPVTSQQIADYLKIPVQRVHDIMSKIRHRIPDYTVTVPHESQPNTKVHTIDPHKLTMSVESIYAHYRVPNPQKRAGRPKEAQESQPMSRIHPEITADLRGLKLEVFGKIEVVFKWDKG